jgi:hypothetical protein
MASSSPDLRESSPGAGQKCNQWGPWGRASRVSAVEAPDPLYPALFVRHIWRRRRATEAHGTMRIAGENPLRLETWRRSERTFTE